MNIKKNKYREASEVLNKIDGPLNFGKLLWATRIGEEMSQVEFAKILGISKSHLSDIEKRRKTVSPKRAARFAEILGYSEKQYVRLALQDILDNAGLKLTVEIKGA